MPQSLAQSKTYPAARIARARRLSFMLFGLTSGQALAAPPPPDWSSVGSSSARPVQPSAPPGALNRSLPGSICPANQPFDPNLTYQLLVDGVAQNYQFNVSFPASNQVTLGGDKGLNGLATWASGNGSQQHTLELVGRDASGHDVVHYVLLGSWPSNIHYIGNKSQKNGFMESGVTISFTFNTERKTCS